MLLGKQKQGTDDLSILSVMNALIGLQKACFVGPPSHTIHENTSLSSVY